ncbi:15557_t:CDS:2 [Funneliformis geosporum]|uniref:15557_t:CDS:1 n=1 Tax=Funneliformis geosporum TaxID=1117311 RepID=A0A9W4XBL7_9GLOM|nr:15557_t:CDS:2 [Funneliformis geosporum]
MVMQVFKVLLSEWLNDFVVSNNVNILNGEGQFGTRGKDASLRSLYQHHLSPTQHERSSTHKMTSIISPVTHSSTPWAKMILKSSSLREIQEMEPPNESCCVYGYYSFHRMISKEKSTPSNSSYEIIGPNFARLLLSTSPVVSTLAWKFNNSAPKKNALEKFRKKKEEA